LPIWENSRHLAARAGPDVAVGRNVQGRVAPGFFVDSAMWQDLWAALALMLVLEGILPFVNPGMFRNMLRMVGEMDDRSLRNGGLFTMLAGLLLLYLVR
jgi:uncharacterized protein YjeT (DUF2065 family)